MKSRSWRSILLVACIAAALVFGGAYAAFASADSDAKDAIAEKVARITATRITQEQREVAAARVKLMKAVAEVGANATTGLSASEAGKLGKTDTLSAQGFTASAVMEPTQGGIPDYFGTTPNWAFSPLLRKFVDTLPGVGPDNANNLGQYIPVAKPDTVTYPGSDYYEIELRQYTEQMHSDLPPTTLRGYVQVNKGTDGDGNNTLEPDPIHYLGPHIIARKDRPVRIKFTNKLPNGEEGDLFIPVDTTVMGAGMGPYTHEELMMTKPATMTMDRWMNYTQNRGTLHLHGGITPWISDGTPHQWITPAGENTPYPKGVSVQNVPDMPDPGDGSMTFFYSNQQSARLMFYHDHSYGITRLNVYAGEAAGYQIVDEAEEKLIADGTIPSDQIPLIIQDKTFVDANTILQTDPTWNWGTGSKDASGNRVPQTGDLWIPHVYIPAQNPALQDGINPTGRWHFGPWFWPPTTNLEKPPIPNPYYDPVNAPWEPELMPATPNPSMGMEMFHDTPLVNGTAYPKLEVSPKAYRLRILNASNDRFWNLQMYVADESVVTSDNRTNTEVKMVPAVPTPGFPELWPTDGRDGGAPDPATAGPKWIQIGTEGGFLPKPTVIDQQPITWNMDPTMFNFGNVQDHSLLLGCAERADVIVDFSQYAGKTLILYNDAPAAFPARDPRVDYYTDDLDYTDSGGTKSTGAGFGPNTRTIMQIVVTDTAPAPEWGAAEMAALEAAFASTDTTAGVFESSQNPIIVPDSRYNSAYNATFAADPYVRIYDNVKKFKTLDSRTITMPLEPKAIQDEMGEAFDTVYGRMSGKLGLEMPRTNAGNANFILYSYFDPVTEKLTDSMSPLSPVGEDGTQLWKITHNGVDTHPIHFHLFDVQLINRVGWDGFIRPPDDNELGWKDTVRVSPLEDTIVALRPVAPKMNFGVPDSIRPLDPTMPLGTSMGFSNLSPINGQPIVPAITNVMTNFGWEYVWHCHILSHEEMDMMRPMSLDVARSLPDAPVLDVTGLPGVPIDLAWTDGTPGSDPASWGNPANEIGFKVQRANVTSQGVESAYTTLTVGLANSTTYTDSTTLDGRAYRYRIVAFNAAGESVSNTFTVSPPAFFDSYVVTPIAGANGSITPSTPQQVVSGSDSPTFTAVPNPGYRIADIQIDGVSVGVAAEHKLFNVTADHVIYATFEPDTLTINASAGAGGSISPSGATVVNRGANQSFTITPNTGYHISDVLVDGVSVGSQMSYAFTDVQVNHTIEAQFAIDTFQIVPTVGANGTMTPNTAQTVNYGSSQDFTIAADPGYHISDVLVDGVSQGAISSYTFTNVTADHTIEAQFALDMVPTQLSLIGGPTTVLDYATPFTFYGRLTAGAPVAPLKGIRSAKARAAAINLAGRPVTLQQSADGVTYTTVQTATTDVDGAFLFNVTPQYSRYYKFVYAGAGNVAGSESAATRVGVRALVGPPAAPFTMGAGSYYNVTGTLKPRHTAGTRPIRIYAYYESLGTWRLYGSAGTGVVADYSTYSRYTARIRLPFRGRWRIRAYHADADHEPSWSTYDYIDVY